MDIIKRLRKQKVFAFKKFEVDQNEKLQLWERIEESIGNEELNPLEDYWNKRFITKIAAAILLLMSISWLLFQVEVTISSDEEVSSMVKSVKNGEKLTVTLMDGSTVKLNSGSTIRYPERFINNVREVVLVGEAFFDVRKNPAKPFIVRTGDISTTVLGTSFNVNAYPEKSNIEVALLTGKVKLENSGADGQKKTVYLLPNKKATFSKEARTIEVASFDPEEVTAWKDGTIIFKNASQTEVFDKLTRWYGVEFRVQNESPKEWDLTTKFENNNLEYVLNVISYTAQFDYRIENKVVSVKY